VQDRLKIAGCTLWKRKEELVDQEQTGEMWSRLGEGWTHLERSLTQFIHLSPGDPVNAVKLGAATIALNRIIYYQSINQSINQSISLFAWWNSNSWVLAKRLSGWLVGWLVVGKSCLSALGLPISPERVVRSTSFLACGRGPPGPRMRDSADSIIRMRKHARRGAPAPSV